MSIDTGWPSIAASASMPPTPQPSTPRPLIIVVCESVPTSESGYATFARLLVSRTPSVPRYSRFTWWQMPVPGGTTRKFLNAFWPQRRNDVALAVALELELGVDEERGVGAVLVDLHRVVDDEIDRLQRIDALRIAAELRRARRASRRGRRRRERR